MSSVRFLKFSRLLLVALSLLFVGGQQAALAHLIGHVADLGNASAQVVAQQGDDEHGAALTLSHVCTTCIALDSFAAPLPALPRISFADGALAVPPAPTFSAFVVAPPRRYAARAPPTSL
jgi:hypothetical protein